jgi:hypothetical protein
MAYRASLRQTNAALRDKAADEKLPNFFVLLRLLKAFRHGADELTEQKGLLRW